MSSQIKGLERNCSIVGVAERPYDDQRITAFGLFAEAYTGLVARFTNQLAEHGLALIEFEVLIRLARSPQHRLRMTELAAQVALTNSGITRVIDRLERYQLVRREACPDDRRGSWAVVTNPGLERLGAALPGHLALIDSHFTSRFSDAELRSFTDRMRDIRDDVNPNARPSASEPPPAVTGRRGGRNPALPRAVADHSGESVNARD